MISAYGLSTPRKNQPTPNPGSADQLWGGTAIRTPEQRLCLAVLESAIEDGDFEWLESYTFELRCESVGLDAEVIRGRVREMGREAA